MAHFLDGLSSLRALNRYRVGLLNEISDVGLGRIVG
jgi:hypothetical protein